jgi:transcription initiation factor IIE alpha subunit
VTITAEGVQALGDFEPLPTGEALQEYWREKLDAGEKRLFEAILDAYPRSVTNEKLESLTGYKRSSVSTYLQKLRSRRIVERVVGGESRASEELFA